MLILAPRRQLLQPQPTPMTISVLTGYVIFTILSVTLYCGVFMCQGQFLSKLGCSLVVRILILFYPHYNVRSQMHWLTHIRVSPLKWLTSKALASLEVCEQNLCLDFFY